MNTFVPARLTRAAAIVGSTGALVTGMLLAAAGPAGASTLNCGDVITSDVTLHHNLNCSADTSSPALIFGAANVTLNLNGHTITGPGYTADTPGVYDEFSGTTVENGSIANFTAGVAAEGTSTTPLADLTVQKLKISIDAPAEGYGVFGNYLAGAHISHVSAADSYFGIQLLNSGHAKVSDNSMQSPFYGIADSQGDANTFSHNTMSNVSFAGVALFETGLDVVKSNTVSGRGASGISDEESGKLLIASNTLNHLFDGIQLFATNTTLIGHNKGTADAYGIFTTETQNAGLLANTFSHGQYGIETDYPNGVALAANTTNSNSEFGVYVYSNNDQSSFSAQLDKNTGNKNRFGLYSQFPTTGSGNHASGNTVINCFNVSCVHAASVKATVKLPAHTVPKAPAKPRALRLKK